MERTEHQGFLEDLEHPCSPLGFKVSGCGVGMFTAGLRGVCVLYPDEWGGVKVDGRGHCWALCSTNSLPNQ